MFAVLRREASSYGIYVPKEKKRDFWTVIYSLRHQSGHHDFEGRAFQQLRLRVLLFCCQDQGVRASHGLGEETQNHSVGRCVPVAIGNTRIKHEHPLKPAQEIYYCTTADVVFGRKTCGWDACHRCASPRPLLQTRRANPPSVRRHNPNSIGKRLKYDAPTCELYGRTPVSLPPCRLYSFTCTQEID